MSSFCWCILTVEKNSKINFMEEYNRNNISCIFDKKINLYLKKPIADNEIFCNISCGYEMRPSVAKNKLLNNDECFFGYNFPIKKRKIFSIKKEEIDSVAVEKARRELKERLDSFQNIVSEIYQIEGVLELHLYFTEDGCETSLSEYKPINCMIDNLSAKMLEMIEANMGLISAFSLKLKKKP